MSLTSTERSKRTMRYWIISLLSVLPMTTNSQQLSPKQIDYLASLGKVAGFLKYYHPTFTNGKVDWDSYVLQLIHEVMSCTTDSEFNELLLNNTVQLKGIIKQKRYEVNEKVKLNPPIDWIHTDEFIGNELRDILIELINAKRSKKGFYIKYNSYGDAIFTNEKSYPEYLGESSEMNLLALFRYWNIMQYFNPYRYHTNQWDSVLTNYIPKLWNANNSLQYKLTILELATEINDAHGIVVDNEIANYFGTKKLPIDIRQIGDEYVVYRILPGCNFDYPIKIGDIITHIEGEPIHDRIESVIKYVVASNQPGLIFGAIQLVMRTNKDTLSLTVNNSENYALRTCSQNLINPFLLNIPSNRIIDDKIAYLYPGNVQPGTLESIFKNFEYTEGLIVDFRCYPAYYMTDILNYISASNDEYLISTQGSIEKPGCFSFSSVSSKVSANENYYKGRIVVLVDELTVSQAESYVMAFQVNPKAKIIGSTTAGADGDVVNFILPGNVTANFTGQGIYYPDGRETQRIGILPDIEMKPTIAGLKDGIDELLEYAIEFLNKN